MKAPEDVRVLLKRRFAGKHRDWLVEGPNSGCWPLDVPLSIPSEADAFRNYDAVRAWAQVWKAWSGPGTLVWTERRWRDLGAQRLPERLLLAEADEVASFIGEASRWRRAVARYEALVAEWPGLRPMLPKHFSVLADYSVEDFQRLADMLRWLTNHPSSGLYPRQLPIGGLDSKWIELRKGLVSELLSALRGLTGNQLDFYNACGLRAPPTSIRLRILDAALREQVGGLSDLAALPSELAALKFSPPRVYIVENIQSGLAFPDVAGAVVFMGLGYSVDMLAPIKWIQTARCIYWGDCDTHGFAILSRIRSYIPHIASVLMDEGTLLAHRSLWGQEKDPYPSLTLPGLTAEEKAVHSGLKENRWGQRVRLEQERIAWDYALKRLL